MLFVYGKHCVIYMKDCFSGGLSEFMKICALASTFGVTVIPHVWGSGVGLAAGNFFVTFGVTIRVIFTLYVTFRVISITFLEPSGTILPFIVTFKVMV